MKKEYSINWYFLQPNKSILGIEHSSGKLTDFDGIMKEYKEFNLGFLFFYISFMVTVEQGEQ